MLEGSGQQESPSVWQLSDGRDTIIVSRTVKWSEIQGSRESHDLPELLRVVKELGEETDALILGPGVEEAVELVRELVHQPVICASTAPLIVGQVYGSRIAVVREQIGETDLFTFAYQHAEAIAVDGDRPPRPEASGRKRAHSIPIIDSAHACLLLAELAAKHSYWMRKTLGGESPC